MNVAAHSLGRRDEWSKALASQENGPSRRTRMTEISGHLQRVGKLRSVPALVIRGGGEELPIFHRYIRELGRKGAVGAGRDLDCADKHLALTEAVVAGSLVRVQVKGDGGIRRVRPLDGERLAGQHGGGQGGGRQAVVSRVREVEEEVI